MRGTKIKLGHNNSHIDSEIKALSDSNFGVTEIESEEEWLSVPQPLDPAARNTPHALANEVSTNIIFSLKYLTALFFSYQFGGTPFPPMSQQVPILVTWHKVMYQDYRSSVPSCVTQAYLHGQSRWTLFIWKAQTR